MYVLANRTTSLLRFLAGRDASHRGGFYQELVELVDMHFC